MLPEKPVPSTKSEAEQGSQRRPLFEDGLRFVRSHSCGSHRKVLEVPLRITCSSDVLRADGGALVRTGALHRGVKQAVHRRVGSIDQVAGRLVTLALDVGLELAGDDE